jgi:prepilin-type processing-associated H-X9-DG protein
MFVFWLCYGIQDATDGTSNTIIFGESLVGDSTGNPVSGANNHRNNSISGVTAASSAELFDASSVNYQTVIVPALNQCTIQMQANNGVTTDNGLRWSYGGVGMTLFNTVVPPNGMPWNSCRDDCFGCGPDAAMFATAQSYHPGGVNVLMADGSARFIKNSISPQSWMALGTRANGEVISSDTY